MRNEPERLCLNCGKTIIVGRSDKRYCDDICRARDTRKRNKAELFTEREKAHRAIITTIKRNYNLLIKAIDQREEWVVDFAVLYLKGFDRQIFTGSKVLENGSTRFYCFEIGWEELEDAKLRVTVNPERLNIAQAHVSNQIFFSPQVEE